MSRIERGRALYFAMLGVSLSIGLVGGIRDLQRPGSRAIVVVPLGMAILFFYLRRGVTWARGLLALWYAALVFGGVAGIIKSLHFADSARAGRSAALTFALTSAILACLVALWRSASLRSYIEASRSPRLEKS